jgi:hypothetical protein
LCTKHGCLYLYCSVTDRYCPYVLCSI